MRVLICVLMASLLAGCATVRQPDLDSWVGMPVEALDTHSFFLTVPMVRTVSNSGIEIRNYANGMNVSSCADSGDSRLSSNGRTLSSSGFSTCTSSRIVCNNIFYIKDEKVIEYAPTGRCYTNDSVRPQNRYLMLQKNPVAK